MIKLPKLRLVALAVTALGVFHLRSAEAAEPTWQACEGEAANWGWNACESATGGDWSWGWVTYWCDAYGRLSYAEVECYQ